MFQDSAGRRRGIALAAAAAPGFLFGVHLGGLLFFLNPELPFSFVPVARTALLYGTLGGLATGAVLAPLALRGRRGSCGCCPGG